MGPEGVEAAVQLGGPAAAAAVLVAGVFVGLTPGAYLAGPAVLGYVSVGAGGQPVARLERAAAYVVGAALPMAAFGVLLGVFGDAVLAAVGERVVLWYLLAGLVAGATGLLLSGLVVARLPAHLPAPRPVGSARGAFLLGLPLGLAACPACTPLLFPIATAAALSGGPANAAALLFLFGLGRGVPILVGAVSLAWLARLRRLIPLGLSAQRVAGWLLLATAALYLAQALVVGMGRPALFA